LKAGSCDWEQKTIKISKESRDRAYRSSTASTALCQQSGRAVVWALQCNTAPALPTAFSSPGVFPGWEHLALR